MVLLRIFNKLLKYYGSRKWWPARTRFEVIVGAILTQNVSWRNAKIAVNRLREEGLLNPVAILKARHSQIASCIKSSRFYNQKTEKLKIFCLYLISKYGGSLDQMFNNDVLVLRKELLSLKGVGKETADSILLYAGKKMSFVSDAYTQRLLERYGLIKKNISYDDIRSLFMDSLPEDISLYNEYHALIVHHCYAICKSKPKCEKCCISKISRFVFCKKLF
jgi:endonuclease-3 related protein